MLRVLLLISLVMSLLGLSGVTEATSLRVFDEVFKTSRNKIRQVTENFQKELNKNPKSQGYIINYGTDKEIARREKIIRESIALRKFDAARITILRGGKSAEARTRFLIAPDSKPPNDILVEETK